MTPRRTAGLVVAALAAATTWLVAPAPPASAATCSTARGVSVVVDHHELGGGVQTVCDAGGAGEYADRQFTESGFALTYVQRQPGFVCRVDGAPSDDPCVNTPPSDAYWGVWWSDGTSGKWTYSSTGVTSLKVPAGGYVALSWIGSSSASPPGIAPKAHASASPSPSATPTSTPTSTPTATPTPQPTHTAQPTHAPSPQPTHTAQPTHAPSPQPSGTTGVPAPTPTAQATSAAPTHSASPTHSAAPHRHPAKKQHHRHATPSASPSAGGTATRAAQPSRAVADPPASDGSGLPGWVAPVVAGLLLVAAAATAFVRRRTGRSR
ncbi:MAG: hypothetical protein ACR2K3_09770 [Nocardioides sp.]